MGDLTKMMAQEGAREKERARLNRDQGSEGGAAVGAKVAWLIETLWEAERERS